MKKNRITFALVISSLLMTIGVGIHNQVSAQKQDFHWFVGSLDPVTGVPVGTQPEKVNTVDYVEEDSRSDASEFREQCVNFIQSLNPDLVPSTIQVNVVDENVEAAFVACKFDYIADGFHNRPSDPDDENSPRNGELVSNYEMQVYELGAESKAKLISLLLNDECSPLNENASGHGCFWNLPGRIQNPRPYQVVLVAENQIFNLKSASVRSPVIPWVFTN